MKWYTATGDDGYTGVLGRDRVPKYADRPEAYGAVDEASAVLGLARAQARNLHVRAIILSVQRDLYRMMTDLAQESALYVTAPEAAPKSPRLTADRVAWLERAIDDLGAQVEIPPAFIVPGDSSGGALLEVGRTVVRRAERLVAKLTHAGATRDDTPLKYLNRLSSLLFVLARVEDRAEGVEKYTLAAGESAKGRISEGANERISEGANERISESANQRISESANQRISESTNLPIYQSTNLPTYQPTNPRGSHASRRSHVRRRGAEHGLRPGAVHRH
jgi:cob(I)alamin adenosyltransferase